MKHIIEIKKAPDGRLRIEFMVTHKYTGDDRETLVYAKVKTVRRDNHYTKEQVQKSVQALVDFAVADMQKKLGT